MLVASLRNNYGTVIQDCIHVKVRVSGIVKAKAVYLAIGSDMTGNKEVLGWWIAQNEGAKFWLQVATELKNRDKNNSIDK